MAPKRIFKIFPGIGIARIGKSDEYYIGPESPSMPVSGPFKKQGKIKKQAARFRVYEFKVENGIETIVGEVTATTDTKVEWGVTLCNRKAASRTIPRLSTKKRNPNYEQSKLVMEGNDSIAGVSQRGHDITGQIRFVQKNTGVEEGKADVVLGRLETDGNGRLLVVGGNGDSGSLLGIALDNFANNKGWYDDCCDGPVTAKVTVQGQAFVAEPAWVVVGSPAYAPEIRNMMTWYDQARNIEAQVYDPSLMAAKPSFTNDIYPILESTVHLQWVSSTARMAHGDGKRGDFLEAQTLAKLASKDPANKTLRDKVFERLQQPGTKAAAPSRVAAPPKNMPYLFSGVDPNDIANYEFAALTNLQYSYMQRWAQGDFIDDWKGLPAPVAFDDIPLADQPAALTKAALEGCIGGPFYPGIETTYIMADPATYTAAYRIDPSLPAGHMTELMALPWQADYRDCGRLWWPAQRPTSVKTAGGFEEFSRGISNGPAGFQEMVDHWNELGFVLRSGNEFTEQERGTIP